MPVEPAETMSHDRGTRDDRAPLHGAGDVGDEASHVHDRELALERALEAADRGTRRVAALHRLTAALSAALGPGDVGRAAAAHVRAATGASAVSVWAREPAGLAPLGGAGVREREGAPRAVPCEEPLPAADALRSGQGVWLESLEAISSRYPASERLAREAGFEACAALPLRTSGRTLGAMVLSFRGRRTFDIEERALLLAVAEQCAQALDRARLFEAERSALVEARTAADRLATLQAVTAALARTRTRQDAAQVFIESATFVLGAEVVGVFVHERGSADVTLLAVGGLSREEVSRHARVPLDAVHPAADAVRSGEARWMESGDEILAAFPESARDPHPWGEGAAAVVPLRGHEGVLGAGTLWFRKPRTFDAAARDLLRSVADQCGPALERAALLERERALRAAAERDRATLDGIFENAPLGMGLFDRDLRFVRVNPVLARMNGAPPEAHLGRLPPEVVPAVAWDEMARDLRQVIETGVPRLDAPVTLSGEDGKDRHYLEAWYPVRVGGDTVGLGAIIRDVTAERDAQEFQRNVLGIVGHDVRTPLATIVTAAHLLRTAEPLTERQERLVTRIASGAVHIERVIGLLLDYAQAQAGRALPVRRRRCDLAALCRAAADQCEGARPGRAVRCAGEGDATGEWDPDRLGQALGNLVSNALDHGAAHAPVDVRWRATPGAVEVEVANDGPPIPPEVLPRLFEPFQRGKRDRTPGRGLGLGLFIARAIALAHGGQLSAHSEAGRTTFTLRLPR